MIAMTTTLMIAVAALADYFPGRRALSPMEALRTNEARTAKTLCGTRTAKSWLDFSGRRVNQLIRACVSQWLAVI